MNLYISSLSIHADSCHLQGVCCLYEEGAATRFFNPHMEHLATGTTRIKDCCCCWKLMFQTTNLALYSMLSKRLYFLVGPGNPHCWKTISFGKLCAFFDLYFFLFLFWDANIMSSKCTTFKCTVLWDAKNEFKDEIQV